MTQTQDRLNSTNNRDAEVTLDIPEPIDIYPFYPIRDYIKLIYHECLGGGLPHLSQTYRYRTQVPRYRRVPITAEMRNYALDIVDHYLPPDMRLLAYAYIIQSSQVLDIDLPRTAIPRKSFMLCLYNEQRIAIESFLTMGVSLKTILKELVNSRPSLQLSYEDIRVYAHFFWNLNIDQANVRHYPRQLLNAFLRNLQNRVSNPGVPNPLIDPRYNQIIAIPDIYGHSNVVPLASYQIQMNLLESTQSIMENMDIFREVFLKSIIKVRHLQYK